MSRVWYFGAALAGTFAGGVLTFDWFTEQQATQEALERAIRAQDGWDDRITEALLANCADKLGVEAVSDLKPECLEQFKERWPLPPATPKSEN